MGPAHAYSASTSFAAIRQSNDGRSQAVRHGSSISSRIVARTLAICSSVGTSSDRRAAGDRRVVSLDGRVLASTLTPSLQLVDRTTGTVQREIDVTSAPVIGLSADARRVVTGDHLGVVQLWDGETGVELARSKVFDRQILGLSFSPKETRIAACGLGGLIILAADTLEPLLRLEGHEDYVRAVEFSPDGALLASTSGDRTVRIWESRSLPERMEQQQRRMDARAAIAPMVERMLEGGTSPEAVLDALDADPKITVDQRYAALDVLIRRVLDEAAAPEEG